MKSMFTRLVMASVMLSFIPGRSQATPMKTNAISSHNVAAPASLFFTIIPMRNCPSPFFQGPNEAPTGFLGVPSLYLPPQEVIMSGQIRKGHDFHRDSIDNKVGASEVSVSFSANITSHGHKDVLHFTFSDHIVRKETRSRSADYYHYDHDVKQDIDVSDGKDKLIHLLDCYLVRIISVQHGPKGQ